MHMNLTVAVHCLGGYLLVHGKVFYARLLADRLPASARSSAPFEEDLFSSLYLCNKPETDGFGVRPASLIVLIIDPAESAYESASALQGSAVT